MDVVTFEPRLTAEEATSRVDRITAGAYLQSKLASLVGTDTEPEAVYPVYYPDYIMYTTVELRYYLRSNETVKFLAGVDAITGRVGEVDVDLPERGHRTVDPESVIDTELSDTEAEEEWRTWIFEYVNRKYRPFKIPNFDLDDVERLYVPYWIVDFGSLEASFAISGLTRQVERVEDMKPLKGYYQNMSRSDAVNER